MNAPVTTKAEDRSPEPAAALNAAPAGPSADRATFSEELRTLTDRFAGQPVTLGQVLEALQGRGFNLLLVVLALPFLTPIPLPGFSLPFGLAVAIIGGRLALGKTPWLPQRLLKRALPSRFFSAVLGAASRLVKALELLLRPRLTFTNDYLVFRTIAGALIAISGLLMILPLPLPFSNSLPAFTVLVLAAGAMERDGAFFFVGCAMFLVTAAYFTLLAVGGAQVFENLWRLRLNG